MHFIGLMTFDTLRPLFATLMLSALLIQESVLLKLLYCFVSHISILLVPHSLMILIGVSLILFINIWYLIYSCCLLMYIDS